MVEYGAACGSEMHEPVTLPLWVCDAAKTRKVAPAYLSLLRRRQAGMLATHTQNSKSAVTFGQWIASVVK
jgi:hypothetical protein